MTEHESAKQIIINKSLNIGKRPAVLDIANIFGLKEGDTFSVEDFTSQKGTINQTSDNNIDYKLDGKEYKEDQLELKITHNGIKKNIKP